MQWNVISAKEVQIIYHGIPGIEITEGWVERSQWSWTINKWVVFGRGRQSRQREETAWSKTRLMPCWKTFASFLFPIEKKIQMYGPVIQDLIIIESDQLILELFLSIFLFLLFKVKCECPIQYLSVTGSLRINTVHLSELTLFKDFWEKILIY